LRFEFQRLNCENMAAMSKKILVVLSGSNKLTLKSGKEIKTGFFLNEAMVPVMALKEHGYDITYANPNGTKPAMDPLSDSSVWFGLRYTEYIETKEFMERELSVEERGSLGRPFTFDSVLSSDLLNSFQAVFIPGGHAPMEDLFNNDELGRILMHFHNNNKTTCAICHGPVGLLSTKRVSPEGTTSSQPAERIDHKGIGRWSYEGYTMTCYSNREERINELLWRGELKFHVEDALKESGAIVKNRWPLLPNVLLDRELITGQGPSSAWRLSNALLDTLEGRL